MNPKFVEMRRQISQSGLGAVLCEWLEEKRREYCDVDNLKGDEDVNSLKHTSRILKEVIKELKVVDKSSQPVNNEYV